MKDKLILYPFINRSNFVYEKFGFLPNDITLFNNIFITPFTLYILYKKNFKLSLIFLYLRCYFDGLDGYIARKYNKYSKIGEIYDHFSDSLYSGFLLLFFLDTFTENKIKYPISYIFSIVIMICNFDKRYKYLGEKVFGSGGSKDTYSTIINLLPALLLLKR